MNRSHLEALVQTSAPAPLGCPGARRSRPRRRWMRTSSVLVLGVTLSACGSSAVASGTTKPGCGGSSAKLTVTGSGMATGTPDQLTLQVSLDVTGPTAKAALADNSDKTSAAINALKGSGVPAADIQTTGLSIRPHYSVVHNVPTPDGYEVVNSITAKLSDLTKAGSTIDALAANSLRVDSLNFSIKDPRPVQDQARTDAVHQAVSHARSMVAATGGHLGSLCSLTDNPSTTYHQGFNQLNSATPAARAPVPLQPGILSETANVTLVYSITN
ncbi:MAG: SIMPL domain-containing protein [Acidimicrobiales bacterium]